MSKHIRHGKGSVRPFIYGNLDLADFVRVVLGLQKSSALNPETDFISMRKSGIR